MERAAIRERQFFQFLGACESNNNEKVKTLLEQGVDVNSQYMDLKQGRKYARCGLSIACHNGNMDLLKMLLQHPKLQCSMEPFDYAIHMNNMAGLQLLLERFPATKLGVDQLMTACKHGHVEMVKFLLSTTTFFEHEVRDAILTAAKHGNTNIVKYLLEQNIDLDKSTIRQCVDRSIRNHENEIVAYLLDTQNIGYENILYWYYTCIREYNYEALKILFEHFSIDKHILTCSLERRINIPPKWLQNKSFYQGHIKEQVAVAHLFISNGADPNVLDDEIRFRLEQIYSTELGKTPLPPCLQNVVIQQFLLSKNWPN